MNKSPLANPVFRIYILGAILVFLNVAIAVAGWGVSLLDTIVGSLVAVVWTIVTIGWAKNLSRRQVNEIPDSHVIAPRYRWLTILLKVLALLNLLGGIVGLAMAIVRDKPLSVILLEVEMIIAGLGLLFILSSGDVLPIKSPKRRKPKHSRKAYKKANGLPGALHEIEQEYQDRHLRGW